MSTESAPVARTARAAATAESTPPDMATSTVGRVPSPAGVGTGLKAQALGLE